MVFHRMRGSDPPRDEQTPRHRRRPSDDRAAGTGCLLPRHPKRRWVRCLAAVMRLVMMITLTKLLQQALMLLLLLVLMQMLTVILI
jgi:hypothetical protein